MLQGPTGTHPDGDRRLPAAPIHSQPAPSAPCTCRTLSGGRNQNQTQPWTAALRRDRSLLGAEYLPATTEWKTIEGKDQIKSGLIFTRRSTSQLTFGIRC